MLQKKLLNGVEILSVDINSLRNSLREIAKKIKSKIPSVSKIVLFGSFSKDNFTPHSDIDIAIILKNSNKNILERQDEFVDYFRGIPFDTNIIVYTEKEFKKMLCDGNDFIQQIEKGMNLLQLEDRSLI